MRRGVPENESGGPAVRRLGAICSGDRVCRGTASVWERGPTSDADAATLRQTRSAGDRTA